MLKEHIKKRTAPSGAIPVNRAPSKSQGVGCSSPWGQEQEERRLGFLCGPASISLRAGGELGVGQAGAWGLTPSPLASSRGRSEVGKSYGVFLLI